MIFILDACSAINLLHIFKGEDEIIESIFAKNKIEITKKVNEEVDRNIFDNKNISNNNNGLQIKQNIRNIKNRVLNISLNEDIESQNYLNKITDYTKFNGEFYSTALALNLNRLENDYVYFVSDDIPAHNEFQDFFNDNKIGSIITTADFLFRYFLIEDNSTLISNSLLNLKKEYLIQFKSFELEIKELEKNMSKNKKDKYILSSLLYLVKDIHIDKIINYKIPNKVSKKIINYIKKIQQYCDIFNHNEKIIFDEIDNYLKLIQDKKYYRLINDKINPNKKTNKTPLPIK